MTSIAFPTGTIYGRSSLSCSRLSPMHTDPLSDVLTVLRPRTCVAGGYDFGGEWSIQYEMHDGIKCFAVVSGRCWLAVDGHSQPILLEADDCVLLPNGRRFRLAKDLDFQLIHISDVADSDWRGGIATVHGGGDTLVLGGHFAFCGEHTEMLLGAMPPILRLREQRDKEGLRWALDRMRCELMARRPGSTLVVHNLAQLLLVETLRLYVAQGIGNASGWLFALGDPRIAPAVISMHAEPGARWTLPLLAETAGMSRSKFALRFKNVTGLSPINYLLRWRMLLACDRLTAKREPISAIALSLGYDSDAAFSTAFKRVMGQSPRQYAAQHGKARVSAA